SVVVGIVVSVGVSVGTGVSVGSSVGPSVGAMTTGKEVGSAVAGSLDGGSVTVGASVVGDGSTSDGGIPVPAKFPVAYRIIPATTAITSKTLATTAHSGTCRRLVMTDAIDGFEPGCGNGGSVLGGSGVVKKPEVCIWIGLVRAAISSAVAKSDN